MALIFPNNPTLDQVYQSGSSSTYKWNGKYWTVSAPIQTGLTVTTASYSERVAFVQSTPPPTGTGSLWYSTETGNTYIKAGTQWVPATNGTVNSVSASVATSSSFAVTASAFVGSQAEYLLAGKAISQTFVLGHNTITNFSTPTVNTLVTSSFNTTTGVFTAGRAATYRVGGSFIVNLSSDSIGEYYSLSIKKNGTTVAEQLQMIYSTLSTFKSNIIPPTLVACNTGDTITFSWYQSVNGNRSNTASAGQNYITVEELPIRIQK